MYVCMYVCSQVPSTRNRINLWSQRYYSVARYLPGGKRIIINDFCVLFCSSHAMTSSVINYSVDARKNKIDLLNNIAIKAVKLRNSFVRNDVSSLKTIALLKCIYVGLSYLILLRPRLASIRIWHKRTL